MIFILGVFPYFSHLGGAKICLKLFSSLNSIVENNSQVCVFRAINECYEELCNVRMYVCMYQTGSVNYGQMVGVFVFFFLIKQNG